jgi:hypothetical protein
MLMITEVVDWKRDMGVVAFVLMLGTAVGVALGLYYGLKTIKLI